MSAPAGWCIDAAQALDLGYPKSAARLHDACPSQRCGCGCHSKEEA